MSTVVTTSIDQIATNLVETIRTYESAIVALSAGVDSAVVSQAAYLALGKQALAVTASSVVWRTGELDEGPRSGPADRHHASNQSTPMISGTGIPAK